MTALIVVSALSLLVITTLSWAIRSLVAEMLRRDLQHQKRMAEAQEFIQHQRHCLSRAQEDYQELTTRPDGDRAKLLREKHRSDRVGARIYAHMVRGNFPKVVVDAWMNSGKINT